LPPAGCRPEAGTRAGTPFDGPLPPAGSAENNVELAWGDLKDPASLRAACEGVTAVLSTASSTFSRQLGDSIDAVDRQGQLNLIEAARAAGVKHFVFVSFYPIAVDFALQRAKRTVEQALISCGLAYTILRPTYFMEVWFGPEGGFDVAGRRARIYGSGENPMSWISFANVAEFAVRALESPAARNAILPLGGPQALTPNEVVKVFEELGGAPFTVDYLLESVLRDALAAARKPLDEAFAALALGYAHGGAIDMQATLQALPVRLATVREFAQWVLTEGRSAE
jgi:NADH dehydrogenase